MSKFLDLNGLSRLWGKIKARIDSKTELVVGTQTATTASWTGTTTLSEITDGTTIRYWLPQTSASNATLNLTLADGTKTGAKNVYINGASRCGTHVAAGNLVTMTYRSGVTIGTTQYTGWWISRSQDTTTNYYDRTAYKASVTAAEEIAAGRVGVFNASGQLIKLSSTAFDLTKPIVYVGTAYVTGKMTQTNNYIMWGTAFALANTVSGFSGTAGAAVYVKGTISGKMFQPASSGFLTCTQPTSDDGYTYLLLGMMSTAANMVLPPVHPLFVYRNGEFGPIERPQRNQLHPPAIQAGENLPAGTLAGYFANTCYRLFNPSGSSTYLELTKPIVYVESTIAKDQYGSNNYLTYDSVDIRTVLEDQEVSYTVGEMLWAYGIIYEEYRDGIWFQCVGMTTNRDEIANSIFRLNTFYSDVDYFDDATVAYLNYYSRSIGLIPIGVMVSPTHCCLQADHSIYHMIIGHNKDCSLATNALFQRGEESYDYSALPPQTDGIYYLQFTVSDGGKTYRKDWATFPQSANGVSF